MACSRLRLLSVAAAAAAAGVFGAGSAMAGHGTGGDPYVFTNVGGDHLWSNPDNWNQPEPPGPGHVAWINFTSDAAIINHDAGSTGELVIGQGGGDGAVEMTTGGSITTPATNMAWGTDRSGSWTQDGGSANLGELRMGRGPGGIAATVNISGGTVNTSVIQMSSRTDEGGPAGANSLFTMSGGTLTNAGGWEVGHLGGDATVLIEGGTITSGAIRLSDLSADSNASASLTMTGGSLTTNQIAIGARSGGTGTGDVTVGGNADLNFTTNAFMRANVGTFTVQGSQATITGSRNGATGFEVHTGTETNFIFDSDGISTMNLNGGTGSRLQFSNLTGEPTGVLNVDATAYEDVGEFYLIRFIDTIAGGVVGEGEFSADNLQFAPGFSGSVSYIRDQGVAGNGLVLTIVPEPGMLSLLGLGGLAMLRRRRTA